MLVLRYCLGVSVSLAIAVIYGVAVSAQDSPSKPESSGELPPASASLLMPESAVSNDGFSSEPRVSEIKQMQEQPVTPPSNPSPSAPVEFEVSPTPSSPAPFPTTPPPTENIPRNFLNPSGNPLNFPTRPSEVNITVRQPITLNQALELAIQNNRDLQTARLELERFQAQLEAARSALFPTLDAQFSLSRDFSEQAFSQVLPGLNDFFPQTVQTISGQTSTNAQGSVNLTYNIFTGGERAARIERAEREVQRNRLIIEQTAEQVRFDVTDRYYRLQNADAQVAIAQAAVEDATQSLRDANLLEQAGLGTRFDVLRAEGDLATANEALTRAIAEQRIARRQLANILSIGPKVELTAADEIAEAGTWPLSLDDSIVRAYKNRSELEQQLVQGEISEQDSLIALSQIQPKIDFLANYDYRNDFDSSEGVLDGYSFQARVTWRFFDGGRAFAEARAAYRQMDEANTEFARLRGQVRVEVEEAYFGLIANRENIQSTRVNVGRFEEALRLARLRFQAGVGTQTDVINAQRDLTDARGRFLQAIIGYNQSLNALQRAVSNLPDGRLFQAR